MPRSAALKSRPDPADAETEQTENKPLDNANEADTQFREGQVSEDDLGRAVAKRLGWADKDEWTRAPDKWRDWRDYLDQTPKELETLKERLRRTTQAAADAIEDERRRARIEAQAEIKAAAEAGDPERAERAARQLEQNAGPPPQTVAWIGRNAWFNEDPDAQGLAVSVIRRLHGEGRNIEDQLAGAEEAVKRRFPEHFGHAEARRETKTEEARKPNPTPPPMQGGQRGTETRTKARTFADIPAGDRGLFDKHFRKRFEAQLGSAKAAEEKYAASYWREKE